MRNFYTTPQCKIVLHTNNDVLTTSGEDEAFSPQEDGFVLDMTW